MINNLPIFAICGYSGSGKTTLLESIIPVLTARNLRVAVVKHDCHGLTIDHEGKDSDRFFCAGADVVAQGPGESLLRTHCDVGGLENLLRSLCLYYDLVLVEGHKTSPLPHKIWLLTDGDDAPPSEAGPLELVLSRDADRNSAILEWLDKHLANDWLSTPLYAGILIGGKASRMGREKHLLTRNGKTWLEHIVETVQPFVERSVLLGSAPVPDALTNLTVLPDIPDAAGPLAGMLAAMRWQPFASWLFVACDMPLLSAGAGEWLLSTRRPGVWATLPRLTSGHGVDPRVEPLLAHYDMRSRHLLEQCARPADMAQRPQVATPIVPDSLAPAWRNINTPEELDSLAREGS